ncbi:MAG TPA: hypothetical protein PLC42_05180 [Parachlamydiaceae bacterium]|nr:hypothetical protein [Parachlamydiaceae bacterium]
MSSPVSDRAQIFYNPELEQEIKDMIKEEGQTALVNTSLKLKTALKEQVDSYVGIAIPVVTSPITFAALNLKKRNKEVRQVV